MTKKAEKILIITNDEHSPQVMGCMGDPIVRTPNMDRLAERGVIFENAYCNNPICVPGRYSTMTGKYVRDIGALTYGEGLDPKTWTYPKHFARAGYQTTCSGKMHFMGLEQMHGWMFRPFGDMEYVDGHYKMPGLKEDPRKDIPRVYRKGGLDGWVKDAKPGNNGFIIFDESATREAVINLTDYFKGTIMPLYNPDRPLLFQVGYKTPHWPFWAPKELFDYYRERITMPAVKEHAAHPYFKHHVQGNHLDITDDDVLNARAAYWGLVEWNDMQIGIVLKCLEELGVLDEFMIVFHADHAEMAGEHGCWGKGVPNEWSTRVPFMISWPGQIPAGKRIRENVSLVDLFPTISDYAGLSIPEGLRGDSLRPLIEGKDTGKFRERIVVSEFHNSLEAGWVMAKKGDMKLVSYKQDQPDQLFDLSKDPNEVTNLAGKEGYRDTQKEMQAHIDGLPELWHWNEDTEKEYRTPPTTT